MGGIFDLSGAGKVWGNTELNAFRMAIDDYQATNNKLTVKFKIEDCQHENSKGISAFQKLTSIDNIKYIVGPTWEVFVATMPLCEAKKVICFAPSHNGVGFQQKTTPLKYSFSAYFDERGYAEAIANEINLKKFNKIGLVSANSAYQDTLVNQLQRQLLVKPTFVERVNDEQSDFRSIILRHDATLDGLIIFLPADKIGQFIKQWAQIRSDKPTLFSDDTLYYLSLAEAKAVKQSGFRIMSSVPQAASDSDFTWTARYKKRFSKLPESPNGPVVYDEVQLLLSCIEDDPSTDSVSSCLARTKSYRGASGTISFGNSQTVTTRSFELLEYH